MAITYSNEIFGQGGTSPISTAGSGGSAAINPGDLIVAFVMGIQTSGISFAVSDSVNTGNYTLANNNNFSAGLLQIATFYKVCNGTGNESTIVITATGTGADFTFLVCSHYVGFVNTPTLIPADVTTNFANSAGPAAATGFNNSQANEVIVVGAMASNGGSLSAAPGGSWIGPGAFSSNKVESYCEVKSTAGNAISFSDVMTTTDNWIVSAVGFYDAAANTAPSKFPPFGIGALPFANPTNGALAAAVAPLGWIISRRQQLAKERNAGLRSWKRDEVSGLIVPKFKKGI